MNFVYGEAGRMDGIERASRVLSAPGEPTIIMLCDPAAATAKACLTCYCPQARVISMLSME